MNRPKIIWKLVFSVAFLLLVLATVAILQGNQYAQNIEPVQKNVGYIDVTDEDKDFVTNETFDFIDSPIVEKAELLTTKFNFLNPIIGLKNLSKIKLFLSFLILGTVCILIAIQFQAESTYHEIMNRTPNGVILFESKFSRITHLIFIYIGFLFKLIGISCVFLSFFNLVF